MIEAELLPVERKINFKINGLKLCLKNRQTDEPRRIQGKFRDPHVLSLRLSTDSVDRFSLEPVRPSLQPATESIHPVEDA